MLRGLRLLLLCGCIFVVVLLAANLEKRHWNRLGLLQTYSTVFALNDKSLSAIKTPDQFFEYLHFVSSESRVMQPLSSKYFVEQTGEMKILAGVRRFAKAETIEVEGLEPGIDSMAFSMLAWIKLNPDTGANVLRKPLGRLPEERHLSCWGWYVGSPAERFDFGAHDFGGTLTGAAQQESVSGGPSIAADGNLHMVAVVVNQTTLSFYTDAKLQYTVKLRRPVTDCSGRALVVGAESLPRLGEITFFPRQLTDTEMQEVISFGYTLESLAAGKQPFSPVKTAFDTTNAMQADSFATAQGERSEADGQMEVENSLNRMIMALPDLKYSVHSWTASAMPAGSKVSVPLVPGCPQLALFGTSTSCHIMNDIADYTTDDGGNKYLNLIQPAYRPAGFRAKDRMLLDHNYKNEYLSFNATRFPSFCGKSATFSMWVENWDCSARSTLISRYPTPEGKRIKGSWFLQIDQNAEGGTSVCIGQIPNDDIVAYWKCVDIAQSLNCMQHDSRRHLALVFNHQDNTIAYYLDGSLVKTLSSQLPKTEAWISDELGSGVGRLDCLMDSEAGYTALGHRVPGEKQYVGPVQDWRYYVGLALTAQEIKRIAMDSKDDDGQPLRTCKMREEGMDTNFKDIYGHDCAWYEERKHRYPNLCLSETVRKQCPIACTNFQPCVTNDVTSQGIRSYTIFERQMPIRELDASLETNGDRYIVGHHAHDKP